MSYTLVLLRHGESTWNLANRFTGWVDVPLTERGVQEAREAGRLLYEAGVMPTVVHTSLQRRAIVTANLALEEMELTWLPVRRSWRLNERHYGALQGLDKRETAARYGDEQVQVWRRSYSIPPPPLERSDPGHPANDPRYADLPPEVLPSGEALADVVARMLPHWQDAIVPDLRAGHAVLVSAHGNSLRGLVKHLEGTSEEDIVKLNIPTGIPRVYALSDDLSVESVREVGDPDQIAAKRAAVAHQGSTDPAAG